MSLSEYRRRIDPAHLSKAEKEWFPKWLTGYIDHHRFPEKELIAVEQE